MKQKYFSATGIVLGLSIVLLQFQNCSDVSFSSSEEKVKKTEEPCDLNPALCDEDRIPVLVNNSILVPAATNAVDILFVVDNSGSMDAQLRELGDKFTNFIASIDNLDWQVCVTTTDIGDEDGRLLNLNVSPNGQNQAPAELWVNKNTTNAAAKFLNRLDNLGGGSGDERGILAINRALDRNEGCFRAGAALSTVVLSDEDERSTGGDPASVNHSQYRMLELRDFPQSVFDTLATLGLANKVYSHHSIVIQPAVPELGVAKNEMCYVQQSTESSVWYGTRYAELTRLTKGILGDICAVDYGAQLSFIGQNIGATLNSIPLECEPVKASGARETNANNIILAPRPTQTATLAGNKLNFTPALTPGTTLNLRYYCLRDVVR